MSCHLYHPCHRPDLEQTFHPDLDSLVLPQYRYQA